MDTSRLVFRLDFVKFIEQKIMCMSKDANAMQSVIDVNRKKAVGEGVVKEKNGNHHRSVHSHLRVMSPQHDRIPVLVLFSKEYSPKLRF